MDIDFSAMKVGDKVALPQGKWNDALRVFLDAANAHSKGHPDNPQFQVIGSDGSDFEKAQYWIERIR